MISSQTRDCSTPKTVTRLLKVQMSPMAQQPPIHPRECRTPAKNAYHLLLQSSLFMYNSLVHGSSPQCNLDPLTCRPSNITTLLSLTRFSSLPKTDRCQHFSQYFLFCTRLPSPSGVFTFLRRSLPKRGCHLRETSLEECDFAPLARQPQHFA
jgi:hypothetical protein